MSSSSSSTEPAGMVEDWRRIETVSNIEAMLSETTEAEASAITEYSIYKVPDQIRKLNKNAYTPKFVSIGPFHRSSENTQQMEIHKKKYFKDFLNRIQKMEKNLDTLVNLDSLVSLVEELEPQVRGCYSEFIGYSKEEFVKMILVDAGFILELFYKLRYGEWTQGDALKGKRWLINDIMEDLCLLENQLPFFVIEELYKLARPTSQRGELPTFHDLTSFLLFHHGKPKLVPESTPMLHFTDLLRKSYKRPRHYGIITVRSATELHELGVKFKVDRTSQSLQDLEFSFSDGILRIPKFEVNAKTEKLFHNMIALEECHYPDEPYITDYVFVLSCLIKTDEDADFLIKNRIIVNDLDSSNKVRGFFSILDRSATGVSFRSIYGHLCEDLNLYCDRPKRRWKAALRRDYYWDLKRNYCKTPLQTLATLGGILLIILTVIQTICSIMQVK